jgi:hypothetical protein
MDMGVGRQSAAPVLTVRTIAHASIVTGIAARINPTIRNPLDVATFKN